MYCFGKRQQEVGGTVIPGAYCIRLELSNPSRRTEEWQAACRLLTITLFAGESAVVHCMAGVHRAATVGAMMRSKLRHETFEVASSVVQRVRNVEIEKVVKQRGLAEWIRSTLANTRLPRIGPPVDQWVAAQAVGSRLHASHASPPQTDQAPLCKWRQRAAHFGSEPLVASSLQEAVGWGRQLRPECKAKLPASLRQQVQRLLRD